MNLYLLTVLLLFCADVFFTFAWYGHLRLAAHQPYVIAVLISWGFALFVHIFAVPAQRTGIQVMSVFHLRILHEVLSLSIFVVFAMLFLKQKFSWDYVWAGFCLLGAVYFMFRKRAR